MCKHCKDCKCKVKDNTFSVLGKFVRKESPNTFVFNHRGTYRGSFFNTIKVQINNIDEYLIKGDNYILNLVSVVCIDNTMFGEMV